MTVINLKQVDLRKVYECENESINVEGVPAIGANNTFFAGVGNTVSVSIDLHFDGSKDTTLDKVAKGYPPFLKLPVIKMAGGRSGVVVDEVYFNADITQGTLTASGVLPASGAWYFSIDRINKSLLSVDPNWRVNREDLIFLV